MPADVTYPGVYVEQIPSGSRTIAGVATSIAAFAGWAPQGPVDKATLVQSYAEYALMFGGLDARSNLGYAVNQFFANGGQQCYIVRLVWDGTLTPSSSSGNPAICSTAVATGIGGSLTLFARNPGAWGNDLRVSVIVHSAQPAAGERFTLLVQTVDSNGQLQTLESFAGLSVSPNDPQFCVAVIDSGSNYITFVNPATIDRSTGIGAPVAPSAAPSASTTAPIPFSGGTDGGVLVPATDQNFERALLNRPGGIYSLDRVGVLNLLCVPGESDAAAISSLQAYCDLKRALFIVDAPQSSSTAQLLETGPAGTATDGGTSSITGPNAGNSAFYFPWLTAPDPLFGNRPKLIPPCGFVAGIYAATDMTAGVWKSPEGIDAGLTGEMGLQYSLTDSEYANLNSQGVNCLRHFDVYGDVVWGARTLAGNDRSGSQWKYVPIKRLALYIEASLYDGTQWVVFEPKGERLWDQVCRNVEEFMHGLYLKGAFAGTTPHQAYFVKCDAENNSAASTAQGVVNILVGFAPLAPAEFVVIQIQQIAARAS